MNTMILLLVLLCQQNAEVQSLPGTAYARPAAGTILRSDAGKDFPGVYTLDGETVVRIGTETGGFRQVFVPQGYPVYMHAQYLELSPADGTARVTAEHVNMRLLPSTDSLLPIGHLSTGCEPLIVLERSGDWVRVIAPLNVPLYADDASVSPAVGAEIEAAWARLHGSRMERVLAATARWQKEDPQAVQQAALLGRVEALADTDVTALTADEIALRRTELDRIGSEATWPQTLSVTQGLQAELDQLEQLRAQTERATETVIRQTELADEQTLRRESRMLALGLAFKGKGEVLLARQGSVHREGLDDAPIYTLHTTEGEILKLSAPPQVATLEALVGKRVKLDGRRLVLMVVDGPVLVIDKLVSYTPR